MCKENTPKLLVHNKDHISQGRNWKFLPLSKLVGQPASPSRGTLFWLFPFGWFCLCSRKSISRLHPWWAVQGLHGPFLQVWHWRLWSGALLGQLCSFPGNQLPQEGPEEAVGLFASNPFHVQIMTANIWFDRGLAWTLLFTDSHALPSTCGSV